MRRSVQAENKNRHFHDFLVMESMAVKPLFSQALAMIGTHDDRGWPAARLEKIEQLGHPSVEILGVCDLPSEKFSIQGLSFVPHTALIEKPGQADPAVHVVVGRGHSGISKGTMGLAKIGEGETRTATGATANLFEKHFI